MDRTVFSAKEQDPVLLLVGNGLGAFQQEFIQVTSRSAFLSQGAALQPSPDQVGNALGGVASDPAFKLMVIPDDGNDSSVLWVGMTGRDVRRHCMEYPKYADLGIFLSSLFVFNLDADPKSANYLDAKPSLKNDNEFTDYQWGRCFLLSQERETCSWVSAEPVRAVEKAARKRQGGSTSLAQPKVLDLLAAVIVEHAEGEHHQEEEQADAFVAPQPFAFREAHRQLLAAAQTRSAVQTWQATKKTVMSEFLTFSHTQSPSTPGYFIPVLPRTDSAGLLWTYQPKARAALDQALHPPALVLTTGLGCPGCRQQHQVMNGLKLSGLNTVTTSANSAGTPRVLPASISSPKTALNPISLHIPLVQIAFHPSKYTILISFHKVVCSLMCCWWDLRAHGEGTKVSPGKTGWGGAEGDAWSLIVPDGPKNPENTKESGGGQQDKIAPGPGHLLTGENTSGMKAHTTNTGT
ncbi:hypothetical protein Anapl_05373 [Anas platyrhynchos]|uniref:Uncharacterized protein n=1 Tax=Anas platyrhynchos TaxID=8839 RepID=R0L949_ANAPL|nr:hypothetical protein Anapl_05373 [Anas platyrhynchos]